MKKIIIAITNWRIRRIRRKIVWKLLSNPGFDASRKPIGVVVSDIMDELYWDSLLKPGKLIIKEEHLRMIVMIFWSMLLGYIAGVISKILSRYDVF